MHGIMKEMCRINIIKAFRAAGIPYKYKLDLKKFIKTLVLVLLACSLLSYVYINEPIYAKENFLLMIQTNLHLIFLFLVFCGIFVSINWIQYEEYEEIKFLLSLPILPNQIYKYKIFTLIIGWGTITSFILLPFCISIVVGIRIVSYIIIMIGALLLGVEIGAKILCLFPTSLKYIFVSMILVFGILVYGFIYTRYALNIDNIMLLYIFGIFVNGISYRGLVRDFSGVYSDVLYRKSKGKNIKKLDFSRIAKNKVIAFLLKDYISFSRNKKDILKTLLLMGILLVSIGTGGEIDSTYLLPYIACNVWVLDLTGQETYFYQINKLLKSGSTCDYYFKRLISSFIVILPMSIIWGGIIEIFSKGYISFSGQINVVVISILIIFLSVGISILCRRESVSKYNMALGINITGQLVYYVVGAAYIFLFEMALMKKKVAIILFCIMLGINIGINLYVFVRCRNR